MKLYIVESEDKIYYDFSVYTRKHQCTFSKEQALQKAKEVFENLRVKHADDIETYSDKEAYVDVDDGALEIIERPEDGYYRMSFGFEEDYEVHKVYIAECDVEMTETQMYDIYREQKMKYFIEDVECKAEEMEVNLEDVDIRELACEAEHALDNNDSYWESYWMSIEYAIENMKEM